MEIQDIGAGLMLLTPIYAIAGWYTGMTFLLYTALVAFSGGVLLIAGGRDD